MFRVLTFGQQDPLQFILCDFSYMTPEISDSFAVVSGATGWSQLILGIVCIITGTSHFTKNPGFF